MNRDYTFDLSGTDRFLSELNVTDLHFSFRIDTVDTICSHMIAEAHDTWVVNDNEIKEHAKLNLEPNAVREMCIGSDMVYSTIQRVCEKDTKIDTTVSFILMKTYMKCLILRTTIAE